MHKLHFKALQRSRALLILREALTRAKKKSLAYKKQRKGNHG